MTFEDGRRGVVAADLQILDAEMQTTAPPLKAAS
jgi:hypothetical protein